MVRVEYIICVLMSDKSRNKSLQHQMKISKERFRSNPALIHGLY